MIKRYLYTIGTMAMMLIAFVACQDHDIAPSSEADTQVPEGYVSIKFKLDVPEMNQVQVRAVDPDGLDIHGIILYCFNSYGLYIGQVDATNVTLDNNSHTSGTFKATVPDETHIIHFIANQNKGLYDDDVLRGKSEDEVIAAMEGASGMLIYWGRFKYDSTNTKTLNEQLQAYKATDSSPEGIPMIRNQAMVTTTIGDHKVNNNTVFTVTGFRTANIHAFGTVAPYCPTHGFNMTTWPCVDANGKGFITLPIKKTMMSDITEVNTKPEDYIFEHENSLDNPVSVIIKGKNANDSGDKYYRVMLVDENGNQLLIRRNHKYTINITGPLSYGQDSFAAAMEAPATNNVWISVDAWVNEVTDATYTLAVEQTSVVFEGKNIVEGKEVELKYTLTKNDGTAAITEGEKPEVTWLDGNTVAYDAFTESFTPGTDADQHIGNGSIKIKLRAMTDVPQHVGTLMIRKGKLFRTIEVVVVHTQVFTPSWISAQVFGTVTGNVATREKVTLKFTIPETCPESLYPFPVYISVNSLDVRSGSGKDLPVVVKGNDQYYGEDFDNILYKYMYTVEKPGVHFVYFENILSHDQNDVQTVHLEAKYFETLTKTVVYAEHQRAITSSSLSSKPLVTDQNIYYYKVPQKKNARIDFTINLTDGTNGVDAGPNDEFLLYSKTLNYYADRDQESILGAGKTFDCKFQSVDEDHWSTNGRVHMFHPRDGKYDANPNGQYTIYLYTNTSRSNDMVRIASNTSLSPAFDPTNNDTNGKYKGNSYRSVIFELENYHPFHFNATVSGVGGNDNKEFNVAEEEIETNLEWVYGEKGVLVPIKFSTGSFADGNKTIDPFGTPYKVFIDAPMLELNGSQANVEDEGNGRFSYQIPANATAATHGEITVKFKTKSVCNSGEIKISSEQDSVVYYTKTFNISNTPITGTIKYVKDGVDTDIKAGEFVAFVRSKTNTRIGVMTITSDGNYSLNLRSEYEFEWDDKIELNYVTKETVNGQLQTVVYECNQINSQDLTLASLAEHKNVILTKATSN